MTATPCPSCGKPPTVRAELPRYHVCECLDCFDVDYRGGGYGYVATTPRGFGATPAEAIADWNDAVAEWEGE